MRMPRHPVLSRGAREDARGSATAVTRGAREDARQRGGRYARSQAVVSAGRV